MKMRELTNRPRATAQTKYTTDILAWAFNRRGKPNWKSSNVVDSIWNYLLQHHVEMKGPKSYGGQFEVTKHSMRYVMQDLATRDLAVLKADAGRRYIEFAFKPDVILTGRGPVIQQVRVVDTLIDNDPRTVDIQVESDRLIDELPVPAVPVPPYRREELHELLKDFEEMDREAYVDYIDKLIPALKAVLDFHA